MIEGGEIPSSCSFLKKKIVRGCNIFSTNAIVGCKVLEY